MLLWRLRLGRCCLQNSKPGSASTQAGGREKSQKCEWRGGGVGSQRGVLERRALMGSARRPGRPSAAAPQCAASTCGLWRRAITSEGHGPSSELPRCARTALRVEEWAAYMSGCDGQLEMPVLRFDYLPYYNDEACAC